MNDLRNPALVGLCDDELDTRIKFHRGVYSKYCGTALPHNTLFHITPARFFHSRLPIGDVGIQAYVSEDFHHVGAVEAFFTPEKLLDWANKHMAEQEGYFYVMQLNPEEIGGKATLRRGGGCEGDWEGADRGTGRGGGDFEGVRRVKGAEQLENG